MANFQVGDRVVAICGHGTVCNVDGDEVTVIMSHPTEDSYVRHGKRVKFIDYELFASGEPEVPAYCEAWEHGKRIGIGVEGCDFEYSDVAQFIADRVSLKVESTITLSIWFS